MFLNYENTHLYKNIFLVKKLAWFTPKMLGIFKRLEAKFV